VSAEVGLGLQSDAGRDEMEWIAQRAERAGLDVIAVYHDLLWPPALAPLLAAARVTETIRLGPAALNPFTLHPVEVAGQAAALDRASGGRAFLGLVKGAWLDRLGLEEERPLAAMQEAVEVVRRLFAGDEGGFAGERFRLAPGAGFHVAPVRQEIPLMIGTWGPRTAAWAGGVADEVKVGGSANPDLVPVVRGWIGNEATGIVVGTVCVVDEDGAAARARAREEVAPYLEVVARLDPTLALRPGDEPPLERFVLAGTPAEVAAGVRALLEAGAARVELGTPQGLTRHRGVELICDRVLPLLRR
jgi:5,10-methylenetetrahydromethanopterin reductase